MKRKLKAMARKLWGATGPIRRPIARRMDARLGVIVEEAIERRTTSRLVAAAEALERIERHVHVARVTAENQAADTNLLLDSLVREVARLQLQVDELREALDADRRVESLHLVSKAG